MSQLLILNGIYIGLEFQVVARSTKLSIAVANCLWSLADNVYAFFSERKPDSFGTGMTGWSWCKTNAMWPTCLRWRPAAILEFVWVLLDHPRSAVATLSLILKFGHQIYSFGDISISIFRRFRLEIAYIHGNFLEGGVWGHISPNMVTHSANPQKDHPCAETQRLSHKASVKIGPAVRPWRRIKKKVRTRQSKKSG